ncbi:MAG: hypothetical protein ABR968_05085 [Bacteroidales bacterium]|jgi:hypothetical protein
MKPLFSKQYLLLAIALCIITSCKMTGNFAIVKRQHEKGYYIETPSFVKNIDSRTTQAKKHAKQPETDKPILNNENDNLIASVNATPSDETAQLAKTITNDDYAPQYAIKFIARDSSKKKAPGKPMKKMPPTSTNSVTNKTPENPTNNKSPELQKEDRKLDWVSVTGFGLCILGLALTFAAISITPYLAILAGLCLLAGIIFSFKGYNRISDVKNKLKGKGFALTGLILFALLCIAAFVAFFYFAYYVLFIMP